MTVSSIGASRNYSVAQMEAANRRVSISTSHHIYIFCIHLGESVSHSAHNVALPRQTNLPASRSRCVPISAVWIGKYVADSQWLLLSALPFPACDSHQDGELSQYRGYDGC